MTAPDNRPTSLREILELVFWSGQHNQYPDQNREPEISVDEAIAAITALIPEKDTITDDMTTSVIAWHEGHNDCVDTIHRNFTGQTDISKSTEAKG